MIRVTMTNISFSATISLDWAPTPWDVGTIVPLFDSEGMVLAYAEKFDGKWRKRTGLPKKKFENPIEIDTALPAKLSKFMSDFGLIGRPATRDLRAQSVMSVVTEDDAVDTDRKYRFDRGENPNRADGLWMPQDILTWYQAMQAAAIDNELGWKPASESINDFTLGTMFVTVQQVKNALFDMVKIHQTVLAMQQTNNQNELADILEIPIEDVWDHVVFYSDKLNELLMGIHPGISINSPDGEDRQSYPISEYHERHLPEGTFDQAYALAIYKQAIGKTGARRCKECHKVFTERKTKGRKSSSRSTAQFCSDKCKNRYMQRERRKRVANQRKTL